MYSAHVPKARITPEVRITCEANITFRAAEHIVQKNAPPGRFLTHLPFESTFTKTHTNTRARPEDGLLCWWGKVDSN